MLLQNLSSFLFIYCTQMTYKSFHADLGYLDPQSLNVTSAHPSVKKSLYHTDLCVDIIVNVIILDNCITNPLFQGFFPTLSEYKYIRPNISLILLYK